MAKNAEFKYALKRFRRDLEQVVNEKALTLAEEVSKASAFTFQAIARDNLKNYNEASGESQHLIDMVSENIRVLDDAGRSITTTHSESPDAITGKSRKAVKRASYFGYAVNVKIDKEGRALYLEYGTGLEGKANPHPEAEKFGWEYAINNGKRKYVSSKSAKYYFNRGVKWYPTLYGKTGFVFKKKPDSYVGKEDISFKKDQTGVESTSIITVASYNRKKPDKNGNIVTVRGYQKRKRIPTNKSTYVISSGIKPVRYIYRAKQKLRHDLQSSDDISDVLRALGRHQVALDRLNRIRNYMKGVT